MNTFDKKNQRLIFGAFICLIFCGSFLAFAPKAHALTIEPIYSVLKDTQTGTGAQIKEIWSKLITYINFLIIGLLIFVAIAQILRININTYGIKKILPALILAIIATNFSFLFCRLLVDLANIVMSLFIEKQVDHSTLSANFTGSWADPANWVPSLKTASIGGILWFMVAQFFVLVGAVLVLILAYLFFIRIWLIYFLVAIAPLAFMALVLPQTKSVFNQWVSTFTKWVFLPVVSIFWIWLGNQWLGSVHNDFAMSYVFAAVCYYLAITTPFKMGGAVMTGWGNFGKSLYKNKLTGWAWGKAKEKWINPWIDDTKRRIGNWYQSQGNKHNPLGTLVRRGARIAAIREWRKKEEEGYVNQNRREAFGGKFGTDGNEFMSHEKQLKYGEWLDNIDSLFGEAEWKELDLREKYFRTDKGKKAALRTAQYGFRMEGTQQAIDNEKRIARNKAYAGDEEYVKDPHYKRMLELRNTQKARNFTLEMEERKLEGDMFQTVEGNAYLLDIAMEGVDVWRKELDRLTEEEKTATTKAQKTKVAKKIKTAKEKLKAADDGYQQTLGKLYNKYYNKETKTWESQAIMFKHMVTDEKGNLLGIQTDDNGNFVSADITKARNLASTMGISQFNSKGKQNVSYEYFNGRRTKRMSIITKEELASVAAKRTAEDSRYEIDNKKYELEALDKMLSGDWGGMTEEQVRKTSAELANIIINAGDINSSTFATNHEWLLKKQVKLARGGNNEKANAVRKDMATEMSASMTRLANNQLLLTDAKKAAVKKLTDEAQAPAMEDAQKALEAEIKRRKDSKEKALTKKETDEFTKSAKEQYMKKFEQELSSNKDMIKKLKGEELVQLKNMMAEWTKIDNAPEAIQKVWQEEMKISIDEQTGQLVATLSHEAGSDKEAETKADLMEAVGIAVVNGTPRGPMGDAKSAYLGKVKELFAPGKREAGKQQEEYFGYERTDTIEQNEAKQALLEGYASGELTEDDLKEDIGSGLIDKRELELIDKHKQAEQNA